MDIDAIIAEASTEATPAKAETPEVEAKNEEKPAEVKPEAKPEPEEDVSSKPDSELTPEQLAKREANRQSHRNSREAKLRRELRELREFKANLETKQTQPAPAKDDAPKEEDFDSFLDFVKATAKYEAKQELAQAKPPEPQQPQVDPKRVERIQQIAQQEQDFAKRTPEYTQLYEQHGAFMENMPQHVAEAFLEADDAITAIYALMKEGKLYDLEDMSPSRMAMEIGKAEERGKSYINTVIRTTNAPPPITPLKGTAKGGKTPDQMSADEIVNVWLKS